MAVSSTTMGAPDASIWALMVALAALAALGAAALAIRARPRAVGAALLLLSLVALGGALRGYRRVGRLERAQQRYHAGLDEKRHGNLEDAERDMREALALNPGHPDARRELDELTRPVETAESRQSQVQFQPGKGNDPGRRPPQPFHKPSAVGITDYRIEVTLDPAGHGLRARADLVLKARESIDHIELALSPQFRVDRVTVSGKPASYRHPNDLLDIATGARKDASVPVTVRYARRVNAPLLEGGDLIDPRGVYLRPESRWYPSTGELDFHSPVAVSATVPRGMTAVGAGRLVGKDVARTQTTFHWESPEPVRMICLAAGRYVYQKSANPSLPIEIYLRPSHARKARAYLQETQRILDFYTERYGPYPYPKLAIAEIPVFPGGYGSSSLLLLTEASFAQKDLPVSFLAHELAHQWWGNRMAPQGLGAGWLAEAFAEYSAVLYQEHRDGSRALARALKELSRQYQSTMPRGVEQPIAETDPYAQVGCYEGVIYFKGAYVLHTLRGVMADAAFARLLRTFVDRYAGQRAGIADFERVAAEVNGQSLQWFFDQWLRRSGAPRLKYTVHSDGAQATLTVAQEGQPYRGTMDVVIADSTGKARRRLKLDGPRTELRFPARGEVAVGFDPDHWWLQYAPRLVKSL